MNQYNFDWWRKFKINLNTSELRVWKFKINLKSKIQNLFEAKWFTLKIEICRSAMRCSRLKSMNTKGKTCLMFTIKPMRFSFISPFAWKQVNFHSVIGEIGWIWSNAMKLRRPNQRSFWTQWSGRRCWNDFIYAQ